MEATSRSPTEWDCDVEASSWRRSPTEFDCDVDVQASIRKTIEDLRSGHLPHRAGFQTLDTQVAHQVSIQNANEDLEPGRACPDRIRPPALDTQAVDGINDSYGTKASTPCGTKVSTPTSTRSHPEDWSERHQGAAAALAAIRGLRLLTPKSPGTPHSTDSHVDGKFSFSQDTVSARCSSAVQHVDTKLTVTSSSLPKYTSAKLACVGRDIINAAGVHSGATVAIVLPRHVGRPRPQDLEAFGLRHPADIPGWTELQDGCALGLVMPRKRDCQATTIPDDDEAWVAHGQAKQFCRIQSQVVKLVKSLLYDHVEEKQIEKLGWAQQNEWHEFVGRLLPGMRMWPLQDTLINRLLIFNIAHRRFQSRFSCFRLDRGREFLYIVRLHMGEEIAFLFAWQSYYLHILAFFVLCTLPVIVIENIQDPRHCTDKPEWSLITQPLLVVVFGVLMTVMWPRRARFLVQWWQAHGENVTRWRTVLVGVLYRISMLEIHNAKKVPRIMAKTITSLPLAWPSRRFTHLMMSPLAAIVGKPGRALASTVDTSHMTCNESGSSNSSLPPCPIASTRQPNISSELPYNPQTSELETIWSTMPTNEEGCWLPPTTTSRASSYSVQDEQVEEPTAIPTSNSPTKSELRAMSSRASEEGTSLSARSACHQTLSQTLGVTDSGGDTVSQCRVMCVLKILAIIPIVLMEWLVILAFFIMIVWFEIWVIFEWGGCREINNRKNNWECRAADSGGRGLLGVGMGALPSIFEGAFFELILLMSKVVASVIVSFFVFPTHERRDFVYVTLVFILELCGKVGFIMVLAMSFVPVWRVEEDKEECLKYLDSLIFGKISLSCMKFDIPYEVRLSMLESAMKGPMLVSGLVGMGVKTLTPLLLETWRRCSSRHRPGGGWCRVCCKYCLGRTCLAPFDFLLRVLCLIFQADCAAVGGPWLICRWPPSLKTDNLHEADTGLDTANAEFEERRSRRVRKRIWNALLEGERREYEPFDEYLELLLHFLWTSCFAVVWPFGCLWCLLNQFLEFRFDCLKLLKVRRRRFPHTRHMSVVWVPIFTEIVCYVAIFVNALLLVLPYRLFTRNRSKDQSVIGDVDQQSALSNGPRLLIAFTIVSCCLLLLRWLLVCSLGSTARRDSVRTAV